MCVYVCHVYILTTLLVIRMLGARWLSLYAKCYKPV